MKFSPLTCGLTVAVLGVAVAVPFARQAAPASPVVEAAVLSEENWNQFAPRGKEVDAIYGDIVLRNEHLVAVIAQPKAGRHANLTVKDVGGALIDFTTRNHPSDQLSAFYPGRRHDKYASAELSGVDRAGGQFQTEVPTGGGLTIRGKSVVLHLKAPAAKDRPQVVTSYELAANAPALLVTTVFTNPGDQPVTWELEDDARIDGGKEDLQKSPNGEGSFFWAYDRHWNQAYGLSVVANEKVSGKVLMNSDARVSVFQYKLVDGKTAVTLLPRDTFALSRRLWAAGHQLQLRELIAKDDSTPLNSVTIQLQDRHQNFLKNTFVEILQDDTVYGSGRTDSQGRLDFQIPTGRYRMRATHLGRRVDRDDALDIRNSRQEFDFGFGLYGTGLVNADITDTDGRPIPCKVQFRPRDGLPLDFGPETSEFAVKNLRYTPDGKFTQVLPDGEYDVQISHGPEYDVVEQTISISGKTAAMLTTQLTRSVNTAGWVSADFHSHSSPSGDNTSSQLGRVLNLVAEHIEFAPCTEHNRVDSYDPHIKQLGIEKFLATVSGMELTGLPLPLNHQNAFPLKVTPHTQDNGGPLTLDNFEDQIERLALWDDRSDKLVQVNHPDLGWMFYDKNGDGQPDGGFERAVPYMDVIEIHPVDNALQLGPVREFADGKKSHNTIFRWLQLLNQGYRIYGVVNTDSHYNFHGSGWLRNWIQSSTDDPAKIDFMEMVHAAEQGRLVMSNGPFLEVWASEPGQTKKVTSGQDLTANGKRVSLKVKVQCPNWGDVNRVFVLVNGRIDPRHDYRREQHPQLFRDGVVKFDETLEVALTKDAHLIVVTGQVGGREAAGRVMGPDGARFDPAALTNPIYVDVDGDGFQANKDLLDHPLPVKFGAGK